MVSILTTLVIDAYEGRDDAIVDVPRTHLHTDMPQSEGKTILLKLKCDFVDIILSVNEEFKPHIVYEGKTKVLYMRVLRAIYYCLKCAILWYNLYKTTLKGMDYVLLTKLSMAKNVRFFGILMTTK